MRSKTITVTGPNAIKHIKNQPLDTCVWIQAMGMFLEVNKKDIIDRIGECGNEFELEFGESEDPTEDYLYITPLNQ